MYNIIKMKRPTVMNVHAIAIRWSYCID